MANQVNQYVYKDQVFNVSVDNAPVGIIETDMVGNCLYTNKAFTLMTGISSDQAKGAGWVKSIHPDDRKDVTDDWIGTLEDQQELHIEFRFLSPKRKVTFVQCQGSPLLDEDGKTIGLIATMTDISERYQLEEELLNKNHLLQQFKYIIAHDLRSPMFNLVNLASFYNKEDVNDKRNPEIIDNIEKVARKLNQLLKDLINVTEDTRPIQESFTKIKFNHVLNSVKESLESTISSNKAKIYSDFKKAPTVNFTNIHLNSIILNLLSNALKYSSPERVPEIHIRSFKKGGFTCFQITDNGLGIDMKRNRDKIFGLFQRFHENTDSKGLGLFIINSIVVENGGKIEVESEVDKGTTFTVYFKNKTITKKK